MSRSERGKATQQKASDAMASLRAAGHTREQIIAAFNQYFPSQEQEDGGISEATAALSLEDVKVNTSEVIHSSLRSATAVGLSVSGLDDVMAVASNKSGGGKLKASVIADEKEELDHDFYIDPQDLVQDDEEPIQQLPQDQRKRGESKDSDSSTEVIMGDGKSKGSKSRVSTGGTTVIPPTERGRTAAGPQVEHALAYVAYESIAKKAIAGQKISQAAGKMMKAFEAFPISSEAALEMRDRMGEIAEEAMRFRSTKRSLKERREKGDIPFLSEEEYSATHDALIIAARAQYAKMIEATMDVCLLGANKMPNVSYPTEGATERKEDKNPNTGKEKEAKNNLLLLSSFLGRTDKAEERADLLGDSEFLEKLETKWGISKEKVNSIFDGSDTEDFDLEDQLSEIILPTVQAQLTQHMSELFYYPNLQQTYRYPIKVKSGREEFVIEKDWAVSRDEWQDVMKTIPETGERIAGKPKYNKSTLPRSNDLDEMVKTVGQAQVGFAHMLPELALFGQRNHRAIMDSFLVNSVINDSKENGGKGWGVMVAGLPGDESVLKKLSTKIEENAEINYENPRGSCLKRSGSAAALAFGHEVGGGSR